MRRDVPAVSDATVKRYVESFGARLVRQASGPKYAYRFEVANFREIIALGLPCGPVCLHRGALSAALNWPGTQATGPA